ncbi:MULTISPECIES: SDR family NAD(P)-dependent oxidoreductase [Pandoraea]|uniref:SDR family NAD(P)-dependent oxidoreductase n=1 Tax=Pandoraea TaxID=93217 RepID=UPI001F5E07D6|nr:MULTISPECIES: SDR family NAD(P)-dependent oxidoreductase [Pandoraea]MCI3204056.1 short-chain dehydrogenase/reductase [Pandoraea sp. LA3]MDN4582082.1 short-chain dehydrogenase/reductase [Pandoraea capi]
MSKNEKTWLVTGASKGIGLALVRELLKSGANVVATSRTLASLVDLIGPASDTFLPVQVDLVDERSVQACVAQAIAQFGRIDVIVNNAGYGLQGTIEGISDEELRRNFEVNVFAPAHVLRHVLPHMRQQRSGHVFNVGSIAGFQGGYAGWGIYAATKFALAGLTEALAAEIAEFGVKATLVYPGPVRTEFLSSGSLVVAQHSIREYTAAQTLLDVHLDEMAGKQAGDPNKLASLIIQAAGADEPPLHLFAGKIANDLALQKLAAVEKDLTAWREVSDATDFPD